MYVHIGKVALCLSSFWQPWLSTSSYMQTSFSHKGFHFIVVAEMCVAFQWKPFPLIIDFDHIHQPPVVYITRLLCACQSDIKSRCQLHAKVVSKYTVVHIWNNCWKKCRFYLPPSFTNFENFFWSATWNLPILLSWILLFVKFPN